MNIGFVENALQDLSGQDGGTMFQLRNLVNRRNVVADVSKDMNSCEEFLEIIITSHVIATALHVLTAQDEASVFKTVPQKNQVLILSLTQL